MPHLIDSDWMIDYLDGEAQALATINALIPAGVAISIVTYMEGYQGTLCKADVAQAQQELNRNSTGTQQELAAFLGNVPVLPFSGPVAERCARLREQLRGQGKRVRPRALDLVTATIALEYGLTLVTRNRDDYKDVPGLQLYP
jgi:tRNA(fMet)-specific endonuclease VapC